MEMPNKKRSIDEMIVEFSDKIQLLKTMLGLALNSSDYAARAQFASNMAVTLRMLVCPDVDGGNPLVKLTRIKTNILFPFQHNMEAFNELKGYLLTNITIKDGECFFHYDGDLVPNDNVCCNYLSYYNWVHEVVVDFKHQDYPPLSRNDVIHIVADKMGAHYQQEVDKNVYLIENNNVMDVKVMIDGVECKVNCSNLFTETILCIASELIYSYEYFSGKHPKRDGIAEYMLYLFDFDAGGKHRYKYCLAKDSINLYNTNRFYDCKMSKTVSHVNYLKFREREFQVLIIDTNNIIDYN